MIACLRVGDRGATSTETTLGGVSLIYGLAHAVVLYGLLQVSIEALRRIPGLQQRAFLLLSNLLFTLLLSTILLHFALLSRFGLALDGQILDLIKEPGFLVTIGFGGLEILGLFVFLFGLYGVLLGLVVLADRIGPQRSIPLAPILIACLVVGASERVAFGLHAYRNPHAINAIGLRLPLHGYAQLERLGSLLGIDQSELPFSSIESDPSRSVLSAAGYRPPVLPATITAKQDFNILYIMVESLRFDMLTPEIMPHMSAFSAHPESYRGLNHYSTGNSTAESMHGIFSGISSLHWKELSRVKQSYPVIFEIYQRLGYGVNFFYTSVPSFRSMSEYVFPIDQMNTYLFNSRKTSEARRAWKARPLEQDDIEAVEALLESLDNREPGKFVDILYLYSTHYNYYFQETDRVFEPSFKRMYGFHSLSDKNVEKIFNRYRNASRFVDRMAQRVIDKLIKIGQLEHTIIVFLGDHGEEFLEFGSFGHSTGMNRFQTKVPLIIRSPEPLRTPYETTSHSDLSPTILALLGTDLNLSSYFGGKNLQEFDPTRDYAVIVDPLGKREAMKSTGDRSGGVGRHVLVENEFKLYFESGPSGGEPLSYTDLEDQPLDQPIDSDPRRRLKEIIFAESQFLEFGLQRKIPVPDTLPADRPGTDFGS